MRLRLSPHPPILIRHRIASGSDAGSAKISSYMFKAYPMQALITEEARHHFELGLPAGTGDGPARPVSFYGRFDLFRPLPSEGVIEGMVWFGHVWRHDRTELHVRYDRQSQGRRVPSSRHLPEFSGSTANVRRQQRPGLFVDPADVSLQRLVHRVGDCRCRRHTCLSVQGGGDTIFDAISRHDVTHMCCAPDGSEFRGRRR
jgi:hypothetical protein